MPRTKRPSPNKVLEFPVPQDDVGPQLLSWVRGVVRSNDEFVPALERLRRSYNVLLAGKPVTDAEEILWQVEGALKDAERSKNMFAPDSASNPRGA